MTNPTIVVIFGITGDLASRKLIPAFYHLFKQGLLPKDFKIVGFSRREFEDRAIRAELKRYLPQSSLSKEAEKFLKLITYRQGIFDDPKSYQSLRLELEKIDASFGQCSNKLFYLAVPPHLYEMIAQNIYKSGLSIPCGGNRGWARILIEKPFGHDLKTAQKLDRLLARLFKEDQIYRIDHYLGKETLQNILTFRFSNTLFEPLWNSQHIEKIEINLFEKNLIGNRGEFYDKTGALKDVGQNHILQMLALVTMEKPIGLSPVEIRRARGRLLKNIFLPTEAQAVRGQYVGFLQENKVAKNSKTETFFQIRAGIKNARWHKVPIFLRSGKALAEDRAEIKIFFKDPDPKFFLPKQDKLQEHNVLTFRIQPDEGISILFWFKEPGFNNKISGRKLSFNYADSETRLPDAYERILYDCILGDQTLFPTTDEILSGWRFVERALLKLAKLKIKKYKIGADWHDLV